MGGATRDARPVWVNMIMLDSTTHIDWQIGSLRASVKDIMFSIGYHLDIPNENVNMLPDEFHIYLNNEY